MQSVRVAFTVLEAVAEDGPVGVSELSRRLGTPKSTVQRSLNVLSDLGWIRPATREDGRRWTITTKALTIGGHVAEVDGLRYAALPVMQDLGRRTEETIHLTIPEGRAVVLVDKVDSTLPVRTVSWIGGRAPIHASASGKAILAAMPDEDVRARLGDDLESYTELTVVSLSALLDELIEIRARGYAVNPGQWRSDVAAVGAAILDRNGRPLASLSVSTPASRLSEERSRAYGELVAEGVRHVSSVLRGK